MDKRRNRKFNNWNNQNKNEQQQKNNQQKNNQQKNVVQQKTFQFNPARYEDDAANRERNKAIQELKERTVKCPICGEPITDLASCLTDKKSGEPAHFDCILNQVSNEEKLGENEKIAYIGQGRFGILYYENIRDQRHFTIKKVIEWEERDKKPEWREEISGLYSQIN